ncbi:MAG: hypothetical protein U0175_13480 [Caldilineaceae bacterium]
MFQTLLDEIRLTGPALTEPFIREKLEAELNKRKLLPKNSGSEGDGQQECWRVYRRKLQNLAILGSALRVYNHVLEPLLQPLGYVRCEDASPVQTREGMESGGTLFVSQEGAKLRLWSVDFDIDLDAPSRRGYAYRFSHLRVAQRVLLASGERIGLLTNGVELRLLICDPARPDSQIVVALESVWKRTQQPPESYRLLLALASPAGVKALPEIVEQARLQQTRVTKELRTQARQAVEGFLQAVLEHPANREPLATHSDTHALARQLWREGLITVYRLLFVLKLESSDDPARIFGFASTTLWRNSFSPSVALTRYVRKVLDEQGESGGLLEGGLRNLFRMFAEGLNSTEFVVKPLGGALFGADATPLLSRLQWGEWGVAWLLDRLLWTAGKGNSARQRVHYGPLDVEDLGRVYEALLELEPGIASKPMCRLRRNKLEVVTPLAQGERYRPATGNGVSALADTEAESEDEADTNDEENDETERESNAKSAKVQWIEEIAPGHFYLRVGLGRKASGSYYTPHSFVRFLVQETLGPLCEERSPHDDPQPMALLAIKVLDNSMGSGHFLVEAARFLGEKLYEAVRLCDEHAREEERKAENARSEDVRQTNLLFAKVWRQRIVDLPDPNDEVLRYLPSHAPEGSESGLSERKAMAICKRLVAVHCLYGVDKNPLAVELAKLALWLECHAEGLPLTFLDHRLVVGDSLTGPFFHHLLTFPGSGGKMEDIYSHELAKRFAGRLQEALRHVNALQASVGIDEADLQAKRFAKNRLDNALLPFRLVAAAWAGGVMLGKTGCDDEGYKWLVEQVTTHGELPVDLTARAQLRAMLATGLGISTIPAEVGDLLTWLTTQTTTPALSFDLTFPEVFFPTGDTTQRHGFDVLVGNPPWDAIKFNSKEFFAAFNFEILNASTKRERESIEKVLLQNNEISALFFRYQRKFDADKAMNDVLYEYQKVNIDGDLAGRQLDAFRVFMERNTFLLDIQGITGVVIPSAFHANAGAVGIRRLYFQQMQLKFCYSFENRKKLFDIDSRFKYNVILAIKDGFTKQFACAFYQHDEEWLFSERDSQLEYTREFVEKTGGQYLTFLELNNGQSTQIVLSIYSKSVTFRDCCEQIGMKLQKQPTALDMTKDAYRFRPIDQFVSSKSDPRDPQVRTGLIQKSLLYLCEGKTFHQFDEMWGERPNYVVPLEELQGNALWTTNSTFFRLAFRAIASSTNERTSIFCLLSPGTVACNSVAIERSPELTARSKPLTLLAICNSYVFDWCLRLMVGANINLFIMDNTPIPLLLECARTFCLHCAVRLLSVHIGYAPLWKEQLGDIWRELTPPFTWPVLAGNVARWAVRAAIDAVVAQAYGLNREQYAYVLSTFSHKSYPAAPRLCLDRFDELHSIGLEAFTRKYDPYWDIPLNENLPQPVIQLPGVEEKVEAKGAKQLGLGI